LWAVCLILLAVALLKGPFLSGLFMNIGVLSLLPALRSIEPSHLAIPVSQGTLRWFERALDAFPENGRARWFLGLAHFLREDSEMAANAWPDTGSYSQDALELGKTARTMGRLDTALFWFAVGSQFEDAAGEKSVIFLGRLCQAQYALQSALSNLSRDICTPYWCPADGNLLVNGQFGRGKLGWSNLIATDETDVVYGVDTSVGQPAPSVKIVGKTAGYHGGWFQVLSLPAGTSLSYKVRIKTEEIDHLVVETLVWRVGRTANRKTYFSGSRDWTLFEARIVIPDAEDGRSQRVIFAPVRVRGRGTVWVDDVSLILVKEKRP